MIRRLTPVPEPTIPVPDTPAIAAIAATAASRAAAAPQTAADPIAISPNAVPAARSGAWLPNPDPLVDPSLNLLVLEFRDASGRVTHSIPSARQLAAYRLHGVPGRA